jgi:hypothetical protein
MLVAEVTQPQYILGSPEESGARDVVSRRPDLVGSDARGRTGVVRRGAQ